VVFFAAVASIIEAQDVPAFRESLASADLILPDGMPVVWTLRCAGVSGQPRLCGPDLMFSLCADAERRQIAIGLYGSTPEILGRIRQRLGERFPTLQIRYSYSPPFRALTTEEECRVLEDIHRSGVGLLFVGLGCPKQEIWMARVKARSEVVMFGVGGAFPVAAGIHALPPSWVQRIGLQWAFRLSQEPRRLWRRYLFHNARFFWIVVRRGLAGLHNRWSRQR
jgi:N-acetylglucosaminyldiphosphoundecaprenol N-acetyl-beta-D-mannosaminyltransferase